MDVEKRLHYVFLDRKKKARGVLQNLAVVTVMVTSGAVCINTVLGGESVLLFAVSGILFVAAVLCGHRIVAGADVFIGSVPISHFDNHILFKGYCKVRRHGNILYPDLKHISKRAFGGAYVFFTCKGNDPEACSKLTAYPMYVLRPIQKDSVPENELWVDCTNKEVFVNSKTWSTLTVYRVYRHVFED